MLFLKIENRAQLVPVVEMWADFKFLKYESLRVVGKLPAPPGRVATLVARLPACSSLRAAKQRRRDTQPQISPGKNDQK